MIEPDAAAPPASPAATPASAGRRISGAIATQLAGRAAGMIASVLTVALTTRHLGVEGYGRLTTAVVFVGLWTSFTELGVGAVIVRRVTSRGVDDDAAHEELRELVGVNIGLSLVYCVPVAVLAAVSGLLVYHDRPLVHGVLVVVCGSLLLNALSTCVTPVFMARIRFGAVALSDLVCRLGSLVATIVVIAVHGGLVWFGVVQLVPPLLQLIVFGVGAHRLEGIRVRFDLAATRSLLRESLPQTGVLVIGVLYWRADAVLLTLLGTVRDVGAYGLAYTAAFTLSVLSSFYLASSLSTMTARYAADRTALARFVESGVQAMLFLGVPLVAFGVILARPIVMLLGSARFVDSAAAPLALLFGSVGLTFLTGVLSQALFAAQDQTFLLRLNIVNLVLNIALNLALIPRFGAIGAAAALLASEASGLLVSTWRLHDRCGYRTPWVFLVRLVPAVALGAAVAVVLRDLPVLVTVVIVGSVYLGANLVLGPVRPATIRELRGARA